MSAHAGLERLDAAWSGLLGEWAAAREQWRDEVADRFGREFVDPLGDAMAEALARLDDLARALEDARDALD